MQYRLCRVFAFCRHSHRVFYSFVSLSYVRRSVNLRRSSLCKAVTCIPSAGIGPKCAFRAFLSSLESENAVAHVMMFKSKIVPMPDRFHLVLLIHAHQPCGNFGHVLEKAYKDSYLPFIELLEKHPGFHVVLHSSGPLQPWM